MKRLFVLRHSKAGQTNKKILADHERPLTQKGVEVAHLTGQYMHNCNYHPDHIVTSNATRAIETGDIVLQYLPDNIEREVSTKLYLADSDDIFKFINGFVEDSVSNLLIIGHNPGLHYFAMDLAGSGDKKKFREMRTNFPPRSLAVYNIDVTSWADVTSQSGELIDFHITTAKSV